MITLDWDGIAYDDASDRITRIMEDPHVESIELRSSPSLDGYHVYIELFIGDRPPQSWYLRRAWNDDGIRLVKDILSPRKIYRNVMFVYKASPLGNQREIPMVKYKRKSLSKWEKVYG